MKNYYLLESVHDDILDANQEWAVHFRRTNTCAGCGDLLDTFYPRPINAVVDSRRRCSLARTGRPFVLIVANVIAEIAKEYASCCVRGEVKRTEGFRDESSSTLYFPHECTVVVVGGEAHYEGAYTCCKLCGRNHTVISMVSEPWSLYEPSIPASDIFWDGRYIIVSEEIKELISCHHFSDIIYHPLMIVK